MEPEVHKSKNPRLTSDTTGGIMNTKIVFTMIAGLHLKTQQEEPLGLSEIWLLGK
jgi:hypothetical protein